MPGSSVAVGAVTGVVLLAGVVGFAVGLPKATGADDHGSMAALLPDSLDDGNIVRIADIDEQYADLADQLETYGSETLTDAFDTDVAVGRYATTALEVEVTVTIYDGESGLFLQSGPPVPAEVGAASGSVTDVTREGEAVCTSVTQAESYQSDGSGSPYQIQCQQVADGITYNVISVGGMSVEDTVGLLDEVISGAS